MTIEPCGKDLSTAGGSRDRSDAIAREVFEREPPLNVPYEFLNIGGKKMSTSKGRGAAAHAIAEVVPPEQLRFLFLRPRPNQAIEFDPEGTDAIPRLFDEFDRFGAATAGREVKGEIPPGFEATFGYVTARPGRGRGGRGRSLPAGLFAPRAAPADPGRGRRRARRGGEGEPAHRARGGGVRRAAWPRRAPGWTRTRRTERGWPFSASLPREAADLEPDQRAFLRGLADAVAPSPPGGGDAWQAAIFASATVAGLPAGRAFAALYQAFLGRTNGPRAGWLLAGLEPTFVIGRLREAAAGGAVVASEGGER